MPRSSGCSRCCGSSRSRPIRPMPPTARPAPSGTPPICAASASTPACAADARPPDGRRRMTASAHGPSALFYGHYDVQPVDPLELWDHDPFEPSIETRADGTQGASAARGAVGRQGPAHDLRRGLPRLEGGDRRAADPGHHPARGRGGIGRREPAAVPRGQRRRAARRHRPDLRHQHVGPARRRRSTTMLRGLCGEEIVIHAADRDLHSGFYGSAAANPNHVLARILADLRDADGRVTVPGFYDGVPELPERAARAVGHARLRPGGLPRRGRACRCRPARRAARCSR